MLAWLVGCVILAAVIAISLRSLEAHELARLLVRARPAWLAVALALQSATYLAQGEIWRIVARRAGRNLPLGLAFRLSLAKLFVDQAVPSAGISGTVVVTRALGRLGVPHEVIGAAVIVQTASYYLAYVASLAVALAITSVWGRANPLVFAVSGSFFAFAVGVAWLVLALPRRGVPRAPLRLGRLAFVRRGLEWMRTAEPALARNPRLLAQATLLQVAIVLLDAGTVWTLIRSLGAEPSVPGVFASFMLSSLFRTIAVSPGGLGTFEAASVVTLRLAGVAIPVALSATLLFRALSFWLPMLPGVAFSRAAGESG